MPGDIGTLLGKRLAGRTIGFRRSGRAVAQLPAAGENVCFIHESGRRRTFYRAAGFVMI